MYQLKAPPPSGEPFLPSSASSRHLVRLILSLNRICRAAYLLSQEMNLESLNVATGAIVAQKGRWREGCIPCLRVQKLSPEGMLLELALEPERGVF